MNGTAHIAAFWGRFFQAEVSFFIPMNNPRDTSYAKDAEKEKDLQL
jgi:hypothetical protein